MDDEKENMVLETIIDINHPSSSESGYTSEDALADEILGETLLSTSSEKNDIVKSQSQSLLLTHKMQKYLVVLLVANVLALVVYVCLRGDAILPDA